MPNINAALGYAQLEQLPAFLQVKRRLFSRYEEAFSPLSGLRLLEEPGGCRSNYWLQTLVLNEDMAAWQEQILEHAWKQGLMLRPAWELLNRQIPYRHMPSMPVVVAESLQQRIINLPSGVVQEAAHE